MTKSEMPQNAAQQLVEYCKNRSYEFHHEASVILSHFENVDDQEDDYFAVEFPSIDNLSIEVFLVPGDYPIDFAQRKVLIQGRGGIVSSVKNALKQLGELYSAGNMYDDIDKFGLIDMWQIGICVLANSDSKQRELYWKVPFGDKVGNGHCTFENLDLHKMLEEASPEERENAKDVYKELMDFMQADERARLLGQTQDGRNNQKQLYPVKTYERWKKYPNAQWVLRFPDIFEAIRTEATRLLEPSNGNDVEPIAVSDSEKEALTLTKSQVVVLKTMYNLDTPELLSNRRISEEANWSQETVRRRVLELIKLGLVERPQGNRQGARLTNKGRKTVVKIMS